MLKQRIITAVLLLLVLLPALFHDDTRWFLAITLLALGAAAWEWARMSGVGTRLSLTAGVACVAACAISWWLGLVRHPLPVVWAGASIVWIVGSAWMLRSGVGRWQQVPMGARYLLGIAMLWLAWLALAQARLLGVNFLLSAMTLVWVADIGAYFAGRRFGTRFFRRKLAPTVSPGKSWEGAVGGGVAVLVLAQVWVKLEQSASVAAPSLYAELLQRGTGPLLTGVLVMVAMSVVGDLVESLVKRAAGVKDSSQLLPGHGGVLDRVDALLPTLPLAMCLHSLLVPGA